MRCAILLLLIASVCVLAAPSSLWARVIDEQPAGARATTGPATQSVLSPAVPGGLTTRPAIAGAGPGATTRDFGRIKFPTWGIDLVPPAGWTRIPESDFTVMAQWTPSDGSEGVFRILVTPMLTR